MSSQRRRVGLLPPGVRGSCRRPERKGRGLFTLVKFVAAKGETFYTNANPLVYKVENKFILDPPTFRSP